MKEQIIKLTFEELDSITDALQIMRKQYPLSWSDEDECALTKTKFAWAEAYRKKKGEENGEKESWSKEPKTTEGTI